MYMEFSPYFIFNLIEKKSSLSRLIPYCWGVFKTQKKAALTVLSEGKELVRALLLGSFSSLAGLSSCSLYPVIWI